MSTPATAHPDDKFGLDRLVFFSDAVIAIAITILVLELRVPEIEPSRASTELIPALAALAPKFMGYIVSYWAIGVYWLAHHRTFRHIAGYDGLLMIINLVFLMFIAFMPFPTALLFSYPVQLVSIELYAGTVVAIGLAQAALWLYAARKPGLLVATFDRKLLTRVTARLLIPPISFLISMLLALVQPAWGMYAWMGIPLVYVIVERVINRTK